MSDSALPTAFKASHIRGTYQDASSTTAPSSSSSSYHTPEHSKFRRSETEESAQPPIHLHTLPKGHGPPSLRLSSWAPTFVPAVGSYDELGRGIDDGGVEDSRRKKKLGEGSSQSPAEFWRSLDFDTTGSGGSSRTSSPHPPPLVGMMRNRTRSQSPETASAGDRTLEESRPGSRSASELKNATPPPPPPPPPSTSSSSSSSSRPQLSTSTATLVTNTKNKLMVPRSQWFIRRALLAKEEKSRRERSSENVATSSGDAISSPGSETPPSSSSSLTYLLSELPPPPSSTEPHGGADGAKVHAFVPPPHFHLNSDNRGWQILQKIGWNGRTGLGLGLGAAVTGAGSTATGREQGKKRKGRSLSEGCEKEGGSGEGEGSRDIESGEASDVKLEEGVLIPIPRSISTGVIDLTIDDQDEAPGDQGSSSKQTSSDDHLPPPLPSISAAQRFGDEYLSSAADDAFTAKATDARGGGRLAPIPTYLKMDQRGLGHRPQTTYSSLRPQSRQRSPPRKRVTHGDAEIRAIKRGKVLPISEEERVKREKRSAIKAVKRDTEERRKWAEILGS